MGGLLSVHEVEMTRIQHYHTRARNPQKIEAIIVFHDVAVRLGHDSLSFPFAEVL